MVYIIKMYQQRIDMLKKISPALREYMGANGFNMKSAAESLDMSHMTFRNIIMFNENDIESLQKLPQFATLLRLAHVLGIKGQ